MFNRQLSVFTQIAEITDHLYLCGARAVDSDSLKKLGITCVVNATVELPNLLIPGIDYVRVAIDDSPSANISVYFDEIGDKINSVRLCGGKTLVHCVAGVSRSSSLCLAYLMKYPPKMSLIQAYQHVKERRPVVRPNNGFFRQLIDYEKKLFGGRETVRLVPSVVGMIPDVYEDDYKHLVAFLGHSTPVVTKISCVKVGKQRP